MTRTPDTLYRDILAKIEMMTITQTKMSTTHGNILDRMGSIELSQKEMVNKIDDKFVTRDFLRSELETRDVRIDSALEVGKSIRDDQKKILFLVLGSIIATIVTSIFKFT